MNNLNLTTRNKKIILLHAEILQMEYHIYFTFKKWNYSNVRNNSNSEKESLPNLYFVQLHYNKEMIFYYIYKSK